MTIQKFFILPLMISVSIPVFAQGFSNKSFQQIYNDMYGVCEEFKQKNWVSTCNELNECKTVLLNKKGEIEQSKYPSYVETWNTTLATFDIYSICKVLKEKTSCIKVDCLNSPIIDVQKNINKCSGLSKKCIDWFSGNQLDTGNLKLTENKKIEVTDAKYYKEKLGRDVNNGDSIYRLSLFMNSKYINDLHKKVGLSFKETQPLMTLYLRAEDVENFDSIVASEVNKSYSTFVNKAVYPISADDKSLTQDWMKSCFYEIFSEDIDVIKTSWAPSEIQKHNERKTSFSDTVVKKKVDDVISAVKDKAGDAVSTIKNKTEVVKSFVAPRVKIVKEKIKGTVNAGKRKINGK